MPIVDAGREYKPAREPVPHTRPSRRPSFRTVKLEIDLYDNIGRRAMQLDHANYRTDYALQFRLWTIAKAIDICGSGKISISEIMERMAALKMRGFSRGSLSLVTRNGEGLFWDSYFDGSDTFLFLKSFYHVANSLKIKYVENPVVCRLPKTLKGFRALTAYGFAAKRVVKKRGKKKAGPRWRVMSRQTIGELAGVEPASATGYSKTLGGLIDVRANVMFTDQRWKRGDPVPDGCRPARVNGNLILVRVLPNSYRLNLKRQKRGHVRKTNKALRHSPNFRNNGDNGGRQLFYDKSQCERLARATQKARVGETFIEDSGRKTKGGAYIWRQHMMVEHPDTGTLTLFSQDVLNIFPLIREGELGISRGKVEIL